ncbi:MAG: M23 family metallopeptidase [Draconibacterium sp.]
MSQCFNSVTKKKQFNTVSLLEKQIDTVQANTDTLKSRIDTLASDSVEITKKSNVSHLFSLPLHHLTVTSDFGDRLHPILKFQRFHSGIDFLARSDTVFAILSGIVTQQTESPGYGKCISLFLGKQYECLYAHLSQSFVKKGDFVSPGQAIGITGNTGLSTGEHLHFSVTNAGKPVDPLPFLATLTNYFNHFK